MKKDLLDNITKTTETIWYETCDKIETKFGPYRYRLAVNGLGEAVLMDYKTCKTIAKGNGAVQKALKELAK